MRVIGLPAFLRLLDGLPLPLIGFCAFEFYEIGMLFLVARALLLLL